jgi:hypothetical protein
MTDTATAVAKTLPRSRPASKIARAEIGIPSNNPAYIFADSIVDQVLKPAFAAIFTTIQNSGQPLTLKVITAHVNATYSGEITENAVRRLLSACGIQIRQQPTVMLAASAPTPLQTQIAPVQARVTSTMPQALQGEFPGFSRPAPMPGILSPEEQARLDFANRTNPAPVEG